MGDIVFDSDSRDLLGMGHPFGTCTLIEIDSLMNLVQYFQHIYAQTSDTYEVKGVNIIEMACNSRSTVRSLRVQNKNFRPNEHLYDVYLCPCQEGSAVSFYSICFSTLKSCNYWTSQTVDSIIKNERPLYHNFYLFIL